jgi:hypothetical protein
MTETVIKSNTKKNLVCLSDREVGDVVYDKAKDSYLLVLEDDTNNTEEIEV